MLTKKERERGYHVLMFGLSEENRVIPLPKDELVRRQKDIWEMCFGDEPKRRRPKETAT